LTKEYKSLEEQKIHNPNIVQIILQAKANLKLI